jgi:aminopeptidase
MYEDFAPRMAEVITSYSQPIEPGQKVFINGHDQCTPMIRALYEAVLRRGGHPIPMIALTGTGSYLMKYGTDEQIQFVDPFAEVMMEQADVFIQIMAEVNPKAGSRMDPQKIRLAQMAAQHLQQRFFERMGDGSLGWVGFAYPTHAMAQEAEMSLLDYTEFVYNACAFNTDDPIAYWKSVSDRQQKLVDYLADKSQAHIKGPDIDLEFNFGGRKWVNCDGRQNFPDGEIFTGPVEDSVNGYVNFNMRTVYGGREVNGVKFEFENGKVVNASAGKNEAWLTSQLDLDEGARRLGEFAIGTNFGVTEVTGNTLFDEKIGGTIHMAIGRSIPQSLGQNISQVHWDMVHDMADGEIHIDGELFYKNGEFQVDF